jgi:post-segregation antitoxin (ccd killing protein)
MQVYLPDDLYNAVKARRLPASELLQNALRAELRRLDLLEEGDRYLHELLSQTGAPRAAERARARAVAARVARQARRRAG